MTKFTLLTIWGRTMCAAVVVSGWALSLYAADSPSGATSVTNAVETAASSPVPGAAAGKKQLTGAELYSIHCNRCHPERYPTERTAAQWKTIMLHMQVRASIPGKQARLILQYLQENSGR